MTHNKINKITHIIVKYSAQLRIQNYEIMFTCEMYLLRTNGLRLFSKMINQYHFGVISFINFIRSKYIHKLIPNVFFYKHFTDDGFSTIATSLMAVHMVLVAIIGTTANLCVFLALSMSHKVSNNLLLLNLCVADSMVCIISGPLTVLSWEWPILSSYTIVNAVQVILNIALKLTTIATQLCVQNQLRRLYIFGP